MARSRRLAVLVVGALAALLVATGCSVVSGGTKEPTNPPQGPSLRAGASVASVTTSLDEAALGEPAAVEARQFTIAERLETQVRAATGSSGGSGLAVDVRVIGLRLRSTGTAMWWGFFAGADWLTVDVKISRSGRAVKEFQTGVSTSLGGFVFGGRERRVDRMVRELAERIVEGI